MSSGSGGAEPDESARLAEDPALALADREADLVEVLEERDRELPARLELVLEPRAREEARSFERGDDALLRLFVLLAVEEDVVADLDEVPSLEEVREDLVGSLLVPCGQAPDQVVR